MARRRKKRVVILGSTGSVGQNTLEVVRSLEAELEVVGLSANEQWELLLRQVEEFRPRRVALADGRAALELKGNPMPSETEILNGRGGLEELASDPDADVVVVAIAGAAALPATVAALKAGKSVALANKEVLVMAGEIISAMARDHGAALIPVDSEHNAVHQLLRLGKRGEVKRIILTASGGPFYDWPMAKLRKVTLDEALRHPTWRMGQQITINSATMMNKAMEVVEAHWLFGLSADKIEILVHPEAIVHSMVEFCDGSCFAVLAPPDMRIPIQYALTEPERMPAAHGRIDFADIRKLTFSRPDFERFPAVGLGYEVLEKGGTMGAAMCGANEAAVRRFVEGQIVFTEIADIVKRVMQRHTPIASPTLEQIVAVGRWAAREAARLE